MGLNLLENFLVSKEAPWPGEGIQTGDGRSLDELTITHGDFRSLRSVNFQHFDEFGLNNILDETPQKDY